MTEVMAPSFRARELAWLEQFDRWITEGQELFGGDDAAAEDVLEVLRTRLNLESERQGDQLEPAAKLTMWALGHRVDEFWGTSPRIPLPYRPPPAEQLELEEGEPF